MVHPESWKAIAIVAISTATAALVYKLSRSIPPTSLEQEEHLIPKKSFVQKGYTLDELRKFDGTNGGPIYVSVRGIIFDVSATEMGREMYGPDGSYHCFAGFDATVNFINFDLDPRDLNLGRWHRLHLWEHQQLMGWVNKFELKYTQVGWVIWPDGVEGMREYPLGDEPPKSEERD